MTISLGELEKKSATVFRLGAFWYKSNFFIEENEKILTYMKPGGTHSKIRLGECRVEIAKPQNADGKPFPILIQSIKDQGDQWILNAIDSNNRDDVMNQLSKYCIDPTDPQSIMDFINEVEYNITDPSIRELLFTTAKEIVPDVLDVVQDFPIFGIAAGLIKKFSDKYEKMNENKALLEDMHHQVKRAFDWVKILADGIALLHHHEVRLSLVELELVLNNALRIVSELDRIRFNRSRITNVLSALKDTDTILTITTSLKDHIDFLINTIQAAKQIDSTIKQTEILRINSQHTKPTSSTAEYMVKLEAFLEPYSFHEKLRLLMYDYHSGSRVWLQSILQEWVAVDHHPFFWLNGDTGIGKSSFVANYFHNSLESVHRMGIVFFSFNNHKLSSVMEMIKTMAFQIATHFPEIQSTLATACNRMNNMENSIRWYMQSLIIHPLTKLTQQRNKNNPMPKQVLVFDALDEIQSTQQHEFLQYIITEFCDVCPEWLKVLFTSRPDDSMKTILTQDKNRFSKYFQSYDLIEDDPKHIDDLKRYMRTCIQPIVYENCLEEAVQILLEKSENRFIYMKLSREGLEEQRSERKHKLQYDAMRDLLYDLPKGIDDYYMKYLDQIADPKYGRLLRDLQVSDRREEQKHLLKNILSLCIGSKEPLTIALVSRLIHRSEALVYSFCRTYLYGILSFPLYDKRLSGTGTSPTVVGAHSPPRAQENQWWTRSSPPSSPLFTPVAKHISEFEVKFHHKSILDWLTDESKSGSHYIDPYAANVLLVQKFLPLINIGHDMEEFFGKKLSESDGTRNTHPPLSAEACTNMIQTFLQRFKIPDNCSLFQLQQDQQSEESESDTRDSRRQHPEHRYLFLYLIDHIDALVYPFNLLSMCFFTNLRWITAMIVISASFQKLNHAFQYRLLSLRRDRGRISTVFNDQSVYHNMSIHQQLKILWQFFRLLCSYIPDFQAMNVRQQCQSDYVKWSVKLCTELCYQLVGRLHYSILDDNEYLFLQFLYKQASTYLKSYELFLPIGNTMKAPGYLLEGVLKFPKVCDHILATYRLHRSDSRIVTIASNQIVCVWDIYTGECIRYSDSLFTPTMSSSVTRGDGIVQVIEQNTHSFSSPTANAVEYDDVVDEARRRDTAASRTSTLTSHIVIHASTITSDDLIIIAYSDHRSHYTAITTWNPHTLRQTFFYISPDEINTIGYLYILPPLDCQVDTFSNHHRILVITNHFKAADSAGVGGGAGSEQDNEVLASNILSVWNIDTGQREKRHLVQDYPSLYWKALSTGLIASGDKKLRLWYFPITVDIQNEVVQNVLHDPARNTFTTTRDSVLSSTHSAAAGVDYTGHTPSTATATAASATAPSNVSSKPYYHYAELSLCHREQRYWYFQHPGQVIFIDDMYLAQRYLIVYVVAFPVGSTFTTATSTVHTKMNRSSGSHTTKMKYRVFVVEEHGLTSQLDQQRQRGASTMPYLAPPAMMDALRSSRYSLVAKWSMKNRVIDESNILLLASSSSQDGGGINDSLYPVHYLVITEQITNAILLYDVQTGGMVYSWTSYDGMIDRHFSFSNDLFVTSHREGDTMLVWNVRMIFKSLRTSSSSRKKNEQPRRQQQLVLDNKEQHLQQGHISIITCMLLIKGNTELVTGSKDKRIGIWDIGTAAMKQILFGHEHRIQSLLAIETDDKLLLSCEGYDFVDEESILQSKNTQKHDKAPENNRRNSSKHSKNSGKHQQQQYNIYIWYVPNGQCIKKLVGHVQPIVSMAVLPYALPPSGQQIEDYMASTSLISCRNTSSVYHLPQARFWQVVSLSLDGIVKVWHVSTKLFAHETAPITNHHPFKPKIRYAFISFSTKPTTSTTMNGGGEESIEELIRQYYSLLQEHGLNTGMMQSRPPSSSSSSSNSSSNSSNSMYMITLTHAFEIVCAMGESITLWRPSKDLFGILSSLPEYSAKYIKNTVFANPWTYARSPYTWPNDSAISVTDMTTKHFTNKQQHRTTSNTGTTSSTATDIPFFRQDIFFDLHLFSAYALMLIEYSTSLLLWDYDKNLYRIICYQFQPCVSVLPAIKQSLRIPSSYEGYHKNNPDGVKVFSFSSMNWSKHPSSHTRYYYLHIHPPSIAFIANTKQRVMDVYTTHTDQIFSFLMKPKQVIGALAPNTLRVDMELIDYRRHELSIEKEVLKQQIIPTNIAALVCWTPYQVDEPVYKVIVTSGWKGMIMIGKQSIYFTKSIADKETDFPSTIPILL